jgi:hypothetical protein
MTAIPHIPLIEITPRLPNARLFELCGKEAGGKLTPLEAVELETLVRFLESETDQDISPTRVAL